MRRNIWWRAMAVTATASALAASTPAALAAWTPSGSGRAAGAATAMPTGAAPSATAGVGSVALTWPAVKLSDGAPVAGYVITRYDVNGVAHAVNASCSGVVTTTSCTESSVPAGTWTYTDTPVTGSWTGGESPRSAPAAV